MFQWPPLDVSTGEGVGGGHQVNKFEQVSSDDYQMLVVGVGPQVWCMGVSCDLFHDACDVHPPLHGQTDICANITFP